MLRPDELINPHISAGLPCGEVDGIQPSKLDMFNPLNWRFAAYQT